VESNEVVSGKQLSAPIVQIENVIINPQITVSEVGMLSPELSTSF